MQAPGKGLQDTVHEEDWKQFISLDSFTEPTCFAPSAWAEHIPFAYWLLQLLKPKQLVELGTHYGVSYFAFCQAVKNNHFSTRCYAIDTWKGDEHAGFYAGNVFLQVEHSNEPFKEFSTLYRLAFDEAIALFENESIDLLHIDGLHTYEAVKHDFENWLPKMSSGGVVLFHDIAVKEKDFGVYRLWDELKTQYPFFEFEHGHGLGILAVGSEISQTAREFFHLSAQPATMKKLQNIYQRLGALYGIEQDKNAKAAALAVTEIMAPVVLDGAMHSQKDVAGNNNLVGVNDISVQVFHKEVMGIFTEKNSIIHPIQLTTDRIDIRIPLTRFATGAMKIRIDPDAKTGVFYMHHIFITGETGAILMSWEAICNTASFANLLLVKSALVSDAWLLLSLTADPRIEFLLDDAVGGKFGETINACISVSAIPPDTIEAELSRLSTTALLS